jgi:hypothetical protein
MIEPTWIAGLRQQVAEATARTISAFAKLQDSRRQVTAQLERVVERVGRVADARERITGADLHDRILDAFRRRQFSVLSVREQRYASRQFDLVSAADMHSLLTAYPSNWRTFVAECFRRWESFTRIADRAGYTRLLCLAPESISCLRLTDRPQDILTDSGATLVAQLVEGDDLCQARLGLQQRGFDSTWEFTAKALAMWAWLQVDQGQTFGTVWGAVTRDLMVESMVLPSLKGQNWSWFSQASRPARVRGGVAASAVFVSALLRAAYANRVESAQWNVFTENLLQSEFADPRVPPESTGWSRLKKFDEASYLRFLGLLISEDLTVFFEHAMSDRRRKDFWLRYLKSVQRTVCILDRSTHARLKARLAGADKKMSAAISRARQFTTSGGSASAQAFCLYFGHVVIVEFSEKGNAAHIYDRAVFEKHFQRGIDDNQCANHNHLKERKLARERIVHSHAKWESNTRDVLARMGIYPG